MPILILFLLFVVACHRQQAENTNLLPDTLQLKAGDVVFRRGTGVTSRLVTYQDREGFFSHVGIVADSAGVPMIVHAVPDEPDFSGDPDRVKLTAPAEFFAQGRAVAAAVCRPQDEGAGERASQYALSTYRRGTLFDHDFDDEDTTQMYCTELVVHAFRKAGVALVDSQRHEVNLPGFHYRCILPSQVFNSKQVNLIYMFNS